MFAAIATLMLATIAPAECGEQCSCRQQARRAARAPIRDHLRYHFRAEHGPLYQRIADYDYRTQFDYPWAAERAVPWPAVAMPPLPLIKVLGAPGFEGGIDVWRDVDGEPEEIPPPPEPDDPAVQLDRARPTRRSAGTTLNIKR